ARRALRPGRVPNADVLGGGSTSSRAHTSRRHTGPPARSGTRCCHDGPMTLLTPAQAWAELKAGNDRFVRDAMEHVGNVSHRATLAVEQHPHAVVFGCSDSRVAAEIIFDQGLGETFVVRTAGHV